MNFINLTPHALNIAGIGELPPSGVVARISYDRVPNQALAGPSGLVRVIRQDFGPVSNIPEEQPDVAIVVSALVLNAIVSYGGPMADRVGRDIFAPDTGPDALRERGQVVGVRGLVW